jgi:hypothetical protein
MQTPKIKIDDTVILRVFGPTFGGKFLGARNKYELKVNDDGNLSFKGFG